jgi:hypothetical protein
MAAACPFLTKLGKSSDDVSGDLWELVLGAPNTPVSDESNSSTNDRDLRRYDHYNSGTAYKYQRDRNQRANIYSSLSDIWLCLACALGWTVWLVSATRKSQVEPSVYDSQESKKIHGNVLQVTLGQDPDGTGIPIYHTLVDYVVESSIIGGEDEHPMQVRKCFSTRKLLEEGFANVEVLVLMEDPTKSILMDDYIQDKLARNKQQHEPPDMIYATIVYLIAAILIITSLVGGLHAYFKLDPEQALWGKISLGVGTVLIYPSALLLYFLFISVYRKAAPFVERPGVIIHGAQRYWNRQCGGTLNPLEVMGGNTFDGGDGTIENDIVEPSPTARTGSNRIKRISPSNRHKRSDTALSAVMEMSHITTSSNEGSNNQKKKQEKKSYSYPNAGCGLGNFNVLMPIRRSQPEMSPADYELSNMSVSSMSSAGSAPAKTTRAKKRGDDLAAATSLQMPNMDESSYVLTNPGLLGAAQSPPTSSSDLSVRPRSFKTGEYMPPPSSMPAVRTDSVSSV